MAHSYENFMGNKDFHPGSLRNLRKVQPLFSLRIPLYFSKFIAGMGGQGAVEIGGKKTRGSPSAVRQRARGVQDQV